MKRKPMSKSKSKKDFRRNAAKTQSLNLRGRPMRGGFRI